MNERQRENAVRLACALYNRAGDEHIVNQLALLLDYMPEQLAQDMKDIRDELLTSSTITIFD